MKKLCRPENVMVDDVDRISDLPECVLSHILSCLPTIDAVRTSILSKRWEWNWTCIYNLIFRDWLYYSRKQPKRTDFIDSVNKVLLLLCKNLKIQNFELSCKDSNFHDLPLETWISALLMASVEGLHISYYGTFRLPRSPFCSLKQLKLQFCTFKVPCSICLSNLRTLHLDRVYLQNRDCSFSSQLSFSFPVLEEFKSSYCKWNNVKILKIHAPTLASFTWVSWTPDELDLLEICGENLSNFKWTGDLVEKIVFSNPSKVVNVSFLGTYMRRISPACALLNKHLSSTVRCLELCTSVIVALADVEPTSSLPIFDRLTCLKVSSDWINKHCTGPLMELLMRAPALENLIFDLYMVPGNYEEIKLEQGNFWSQLKVVEFKQFRGQDTEILLVKFLLQHMLVLEELKIASCCLEYRKVEIEKELLVSPKSSSHASIIFL